MVGREGGSMSLMSRLIIIGGASGVGKTTVAQLLAESLSGWSVLNQDNFCHDRSHLLQSKDFYDLNHEDPEIIDHQLARRSIESLLTGRETTIPIYRHSELRRTAGRAVRSSNLIYEGIHTLYDDELVRCATLSIFLDAPERVIYQRRRERDIRDRSIDPTRYDVYFRTFVWPGYQKNVVTIAERADLVLDAVSKPHELVAAIMRGLRK